MTSSTLKTHWWNWFEHRVTYYPRDQDKVNKAWESPMKERLRQMIYRAYHKEENERPEWISVELHRKLKKRHVEEPKFQEKSDKDAANRRSGSDEKGKTLGTHLMGCKNTLQVMDNMASKSKDGKQIPSALGLLGRQRSIAKKDG